MHTRRFFAVSLLIASMIAGAQPADPLLHKPAPSFVREDLNKQRIDLAAYRGKVVLLNFWATWCAPCQIEMPRFADWQTRYGADGLQIIGVSMDDDAAPVTALLRKRPVNYPIVMGDEQIGTEYGGILGLPLTFLIDRRGNITARYKGETNLDSLEHDLQRLLREQVTP
ncbi:TlpA family protein disulfide reductase [Occallatibacter riparius]|uniref:TlpA family protein disulfide reductase n=1 Tax=Occallatibacter riparius TaxID=1002689 RepID=A0A9J7BQY7_9BACT|nr:TlpA disulfide reductase family protein [Occallatibacter riparius]UWZ83350.1 TlpA family protein disulfide reductase [Occallatibacter riparius]